MKTLRWIAILVLALPVGLADAKPQTEKRPAWMRAWDGKTLTAHEWGTFTSVQGSDGVVLDGLTHEARDLPSFVYDLRDTANITGVSPKMETPVVYFYAPEARRLRARVDFPHGAITQWYPAAHRVNHLGPLANGRPKPPSGRTIEELEDGFIDWGRAGDLEVMARDAKPGFPAVADDDPWRFCRQVDANALKVCNLNLARDRASPERPQAIAFEHERCLFYRGLGNFQLPFAGRIQADATSEHVYEADLVMNAVGTRHLEHVFVVHVKGDRAGFAVLPLLERYEDRIRIELGDKRQMTGKLVEEMARRLTRTGLFTDEAYAMARTWQHGWFQDEGTRVLYMLPRSFVDRELPLKLRSTNPKTRKEDTWRVVRTFVGRTELLSPREEDTLQRTVRDLARGTQGAREDAARTLDRWGRFAAPYLRRALALADDDVIRQTVRKRLEALRLKR